MSGPQDLGFKRDPYRGLEVTIHAGEYKGHRGVVIGTRLYDSKDKSNGKESKGEDEVIVEMATKVVNSRIPLAISKVTERL